MEKIWGVPKTKWVYIPDILQEGGRFDDLITYTDIRRYCQMNHIDLDIAQCRTLGDCIGLDNALVHWETHPNSSFFKDQPISSGSMWMYEQRRLKCKCGEIKEVSICEDCMRESQTENYGFCMTCEK